MAIDFETLEKKYIILTNAAFNGERTYKDKGGKVYSVLDELENVGIDLLKSGFYDRASQIDNFIHTRRMIENSLIGNIYVKATKRGSRQTPEFVKFLDFEANKNQYAEVERNLYIDGVNVNAGGHPVDCRYGAIDMSKSAFRLNSELKENGMENKFNPFDRAQRIKNIRIMNH